MPKSAFEPCIPTRGTKVPDRPEWIHEIKHDGYRLIVQRDGKVVRHLCFMSLQDFAQADGLLIDRIKRGGLNRPRCVRRTRT